MSSEIRYYKGKYKVAVLSQSRGNWLVQALESFEDVIEEEKKMVMAGERRLVAPNLLFKAKGLSPPVKEHAYELKMEKKLKKLVTEQERETRKTR